ncbi:hypothetical protein [Coleofasciculus sp. FACHB-1120]|uniref:hypothetical protein n=1 Tax=Coleofasciculus sp. FACHB-1120 TaxID=2692783 RepID=UPI001684DB52|nr:hypothetical protein [Coleofasciculus sp. FACHB-1120]MBD2740222.1 hypothetical protein [Coleofasciculus sp. FACHB-1120]
MRETIWHRTQVYGNSHRLINLEVREIGNPIESIRGMHRLDALMIRLPLVTPVGALELKTRNQVERGQKGLEFHLPTFYPKFAV